MVLIADNTCDVFVECLFPVRMIKALPFFYGENQMGIDLWIGVGRMNWEIKYIAPLELLNTGLKSPIDIARRWGYIIRCSAYRIPNADTGDLESQTVSQIL